MDSGKSDSRRTVESLANRVVSQHLATCEIDAAATDSAKIIPGQAAGKDDVDDLPKHMVRILENDTSTMCYVNAALQALAWCTLLCQGLHPSHWKYGYELLRGICQWNPIPLNLRVFQPFIWLLFGAFTEQDLLTQQDILEFTAFILDRLAPTFLSCQLCTRFQFVTQVSHPILDSEKGDRYAPILIRFIDFTAAHCTIDALLSHWHDASGLCRASNQACDSLALMFDRHIEGQNRKCQQRIILPSNIIHFPCFVDDTGVPIFLQFHLVAVTFHLGNSPHSGHHRAALRYKGGWLVYDDNRLPDHLHELSDEILSNATMFWLIKINDIAARTIDLSSTMTQQSRALAEHRDDLAAGSTARESNAETTDTAPHTVLAAPSTVTSDTAGGSGTAEHAATDHGSGTPFAPAAVPSSSEAVDSEAPLAKRPRTDSTE